MLDLVDRYFEYACSLAPSLECHDKMVCCDADWELVKCPYVLFLVVKGDEILASGFTGHPFYRLVYNDGIANPVLDDFVSEIKAKCFEADAAGELVDVYVLPSYSRAHRLLALFLGAESSKKMLPLVGERTISIS